MEKEQVADGGDAVTSLASAEVQFREALSDPDKLEKFLRQHDERREEAKRLREQADRAKHPWRYRVRDTLRNFWGAVSEGLNMMAYGIWVAIREALLPIIAVPTTWRRIAAWNCPRTKDEWGQDNPNDKDILLPLYALANIALIFFAIQSFRLNIATPPAVVLIITNFLSLSYEIGRAKMKK